MGFRAEAGRLHPATSQLREETNLLHLTQAQGVKVISSLPFPIPPAQIKKTTDRNPSHSLLEQHEATSFARDELSGNMAAHCKPHHCNFCCCTNEQICRSLCPFCALTSTLFNHHLANCASLHLLTQ